MSEHTPAPAIAFSRLYRGLGRVPGLRHSFRAKVLLVAFVGTHVPLLALLAHYVLRGPASAPETLAVLGLALLATLGGTGLTVAVLAALLGPVVAVQGMLERYRRERVVPAPAADAPADEVGALAHGTARTLAELDAHLREASRRDAATGALNAHGFTAEVGDRLADPGRPLNVALVELRDFPRWEIALDLEASEFLAATVVDRMRLELGDEALVGVLGRGRFGAALPVDDPRADARLDAVMASLRQPIRVRGHELRGEPIMGVAGPTHAADADRLMTAAEAALLAAEQRPGSLRMDAAEGGTAMQSRLELALEIERGLRERHFRAVYQGRVDAATHAVTAFEALVRWHHPERGALGPGEFVPVAEQSGRITEIGRYVLDEAVAQAARWAREGREAGVSVNVAARQLEAGTLAEDVRAALERHGLAAGRLELELTESTLLADLDASASQLEALRALGVRIALDDFGTGYSSLSYLGRLPLDRVKLDRSFVQRAASPAYERVIGGIVALAGGLGLPVTAEGVETAEQARLLHALGCDELQGFLFARPVDAAEITWDPMPHREMAPTA